jgi:uncharacterized membrane protein YhaH (DUF805 family)
VGVTQLLFSYKGRIGRLHGWVASLAVGAATSPIIPIFEFAAKGHAAVDPDTQHIEPIGLLGLAVLVVGLANLWVCFALIIKRLHDRERTGWWLVWHFLIMLLAMILIKVAIATPKEQAPLWYALAGSAGIAATAVSIWLFVEIGLLRGTQGPNRFGPDPEDHTSRKKGGRLIVGPPVMA